MENKQSQEAFTKRIATLEKQLAECRRRNSELEARLKGTTCDRENQVRDSEGGDALSVCKRMNEILIASMKDGLSVLDANGVHRLVNPALCRMTGYTRDELIGKGPPHPYWSEGDRDRINAAFEKTLQGRFEDYKLTFRKKTGEAFPVIVSPSAVKDEDGNVDCFMASVKDMSFLREIEQEAGRRIHESDERFRTAFENANIGMCLVDAGGHLTSANPQMTALFGYSRQELEKMTVDDLAHPKDRGISPNYIRNAVSGNVSYTTFEKRYLHKDGRIVHCQVVSSALRDENGDIQGFISHVQDITERKRSEAALLEKQREWVEIFQAIGHPTLILDADHRILDANRATTAATGMPIEKLRGMRCHEVFHDNRKPPAACPLQKLLKTGSCEDVEMEIETLHGTYLISCTPVFDNDGKFVKAIHIATDITVRKQTEARLSQKQQLLEWISNLQAMAIRNDAIGKTYEMMLSYFLTLAGSSFGFLGEVFYDVDNTPYLKTHALTNIAWNGETDALYQKHLASGLELRNPDTLFGHALKTGRPVISNDPENDPRGGGFPKGHPPLASFMGVPLLSSDRLVGMIGLANREGGYDETILEHLEPLFSTCTAIIEFFKDRRRQARIKKELMQSEAHFRNVFEYAATGKSLSLPDGRLYRVNQTFCDMLGYDKETLMQKTIADVTHPDDVAASFALMKDLMDGKAATATIEKRYIRSDGRVIRADVGTTLFRDETGAPVHFITDINDITLQKEVEEKQKELEKQFIQAQKLESIGRLAGGVAHDFNNLLSIILGFAEIMLENLTPDHPHFDCATEIYSAGVRAGKLTRQLLAFSREQVFEMTIVRLNDVIRGFEKLMCRILREDILMVPALEDDDACVKADIAQLEQVLMNLVVNARDAMPDGGRITIETARVKLDEAYCSLHKGVVPGDYVMAAVTDTGTGMDAQTRLRIFEPFFTTKGVSRGTGLGLSTVYGIVKQHGGNIWVYSEPGEGTTFKIYLPECGETETRQTSRTREPVETIGPTTVLVVEDDPNVRKVACRILEKNGYTVLSSGDPQEAVAIAQKHAGRLDILLTDVIMPGMKGPDVFDRIAEAHPETKVIYMSGYPGSSLDDHGIDMAGIAFVAKPLTVKSLLKKVVDVLSA